MIYIVRVLGGFFFSSRRRHTRYWRDWSSDVCSSDLYRKNIRLGQGLNKVCIYVQNSKGKVMANYATNIYYDNEKPVIYLKTDRKSVVVGKECRSRWSPYH